MPKHRHFVSEDRGLLSPGLGARARLPGMRDGLLAAPAGKRPLPLLQLHLMGGQRVVLDTEKTTARALHVLNHDTGFLTSTPRAPHWACAACTSIMNCASRCVSRRANSSAKTSCSRAGYVVTAPS